MTEQLLNDGVAAHRAGRFDDAVKAYRDALEAAPDDHRAEHLLALALKDKGDLEAALEAVERAIAKDPENGGYFQTLAEIQHRNGDLRGAIVNMEQALTLDPNLKQGHNTLGYLQMRGGELEAAEKSLRTAARLDPESHEAYTNLGTVLLTQKRFEEARTELHRALAIRPDSVAARAALGAAFLEDGSPGFAAECFRTCLKQVPADLRLQTMLARSVALSGQIDEARELLGGVLDERPRDPDALYALGELEGSEGNYGRAMSLLQKALKERPGHLPSIEKLGEAALARRQYADAAVCFQGLYRRQPRHRAAAARLARALHGLGRKDEARQLLDKHLEQVPGDPEPVREKARQLALAHQTAPAADLLRGLGDANSDVLLDLARLELVGKEAEKALETLSRVSSAGDRRLEFLELRARARDLLGSYSEAMDDLAKLQDEAQLPPPHVVSKGRQSSDWEGIPREPIDDGRGEPLLLVGLPGSGVEALARALRQNPTTEVFDDRFSSDPRQDFLAAGAAPLGTAETTTVLARRRYWSALRRLRTKFGDGLAGIDWLPVDRFDPVRIAQVFPKAHILLVTRDAQDVLLHGASFGWRSGVAPTAIDIEDFDDLVTSTQEHSDVRLSRIDFGALADANFDALTEALAQYNVQLDGFGSLIERATRDPAGLPLYWPSGHARHYARLL